MIKKWIQRIAKDAVADTKRTEWVFLSKESKDKILKDIMSEIEIVVLRELEWKLRAEIAGQVRTILNQTVSQTEVIEKIVDKVNNVQIRS